MTAKELDLKVMDLVHRFDFYPVVAYHMSKVGEGQVREVKNENDKQNLYYQWLACLMQLVKPKQVVELGAAAGVSTIMMATSLPKDSKLYSVDNDPNIAWKWMEKDYPQVVKLLGDTRDLYIYPMDMNLGETDVFFFDSLHTKEQLKKELKVYSRFFKKGAILVFDDIHINPGMEQVWNELAFDKEDISTPCHWSGFGVAVV